MNFNVVQCHKVTDLRLSPKLFFFFVSSIRGFWTDRTDSFQVNKQNSARLLLFCGHIAEVCSYVGSRVKVVMKSLAKCICAVKVNFVTAILGGVTQLTKRKRTHFASHKTHLNTLCAVRRFEVSNGKCSFGHCVWYKLINLIFSFLHLLFQAKRSYRRPYCSFKVWIGTKVAFTFAQQTMASANQHPAK